MAGVNASDGLIPDCRCLVPAAQMPDLNSTEMCAAEHALAAHLTACGAGPAPPPRPLSLSGGTRGGDDPGPGPAGVSAPSQCACSCCLGGAAGAEAGLSSSPCSSASPSVAAAWLVCCKWTPFMGCSSRLLPAAASGMARVAATASGTTSAGCAPAGSCSGRWGGLAAGAGGLSGCGGNGGAPGAGRDARRRAVMPDDDDRRLHRLCDRLPPVRMQDGPQRAPDSGIVA